MNTKRITGLLISVLFGFLLISHISAIPAKILSNELNIQHNFVLKWKKRLGLTTYRSPILYHNHHIIIGSNGTSLSSIRDDFDGLYILDSDTGDINNQLLPNQRGDRDVTGVAISSKSIIFGNDENRLFSTDWNGQLQWSTLLAGDIEATPALEDIDSDGVLDIIVGDQAGQFYAINGATGTRLWTFKASYKPHFTYPESQAFFSSAALIDINKDGVKDSVIGNRNGDIYAINNKTGVLFWEFRTAYPSGVYSSPFIREEKIYCTETYSTLYVLSLTGKVLRTIQRDNATPPELFSSPVVDENGTVAVGVSSKKGDGGVWFVFKNNTQRFVSIGKVSATPLIADLLGLGFSQFIVLSENGWLYCFDSKGDIVGKFSLPYGGECTPLIADTDLDGYLELILATDDQFISCYDTLSQGKVEWGSFRGNPFNTGVVNASISLPAPYINNTKSNSSLFGVNYTSPIDITQLGEEFFLISDEGIGPIKLGTTIGKMKKALGGFFTFNDIELTLGLRANVISLEDVPLFYIIYPSFKPFNDESTISIIGTDNPLFKTKEGISANNVVHDISLLYGNAAFSYHSKNSLEEFILFSKKPKWLWFANYGQVKIGIYETKKEFNATKIYDENATIRFIGVKK